MRRTVKNRLTFVSIISLILLLNFAALPTVFAEERTLVPIGKTVGITARLSGVCVVNVTEFENCDGKMCSPAKEAGICAEDIIMSVEDKEINSADELEEATDDSGGKEITIEVERKGKREKFNLIPERSADDGKYRIGVWIKDSSSGIGTLTYYDPQTGDFGALGHGICNEHGVLTQINEGDVLDAKITSVVRGEKGIPGELIALFSDDTVPIGKITRNTECGIFGTLSDKNRPQGVLGEMLTAKRSDITEGEIVILSNIDGEEVTQYTAEIEKINKDESSTKGMIIKITDKRLIEKTGGIVRGLSGSPIIQNGKLVGAVTHVFVNDPTRGYGIIIENMME